MDTDPEGPLSDEEQRRFFELLHRVCLNHVDLFVSMKIEDPRMTFYIYIGFGPTLGSEHEDMYLPVDSNTRLARPANLDQ